MDEIKTGNGQVFGVTRDGSVNAWIDHGSNTGFVGTEIYRKLVDEGGYTTPVGSFENGKSAYGCYDMTGNAYEWTADLYGPYASGDSTDPTGAANSDYRVLRGGGWDFYSRDARASNRDDDLPGDAYDVIGFRCMRPAAGSLNP